MKRIGLFAFFDAEGMVDDYVLFLLKAVRNILDSLIVVVNGNISYDGETQILLLADEIYKRENAGYDGEAYREVILQIAAQNRLTEYNELVLFNGSFFGPFYPIEEYFESFQSDAVDFWGFGKWTKGYNRLFEKDIPSHVQSYFVVFRERILHSNHFLNFWRRMPAIKTYKSAILDFEIAMTLFFQSKGFRWSTWADKVNICYGETPGHDYYQYPLQLIREYRFPVLKYKHIGIGRPAEIAEALSYIESETGYGVDMIWKSLMRREAGSVETAYSLNEMNSFYHRFSKVYIFGSGQYGRTIRSFFETRGLSIAGYIVSEAKSKDELTVEELNLMQDEGIIVGVGEKSIDSVKTLLEGRFENERIYFPEYK